MFKIFYCGCLVGFLWVRLIINVMIIKIKLIIIIKCILLNKMVWSCGNKFCGNECVEFVFVNLLIICVVIFLLIWLVVLMFKIVLKIEDINVWLSVLNNNLKVVEILIRFCWMLFCSEICIGVNDKFIFKLLKLLLINNY